MKKRLMSLILAIMVLVIVAVVGCNNNAEDKEQELNAYKEQAIAEIERYALEKGQENYSEENWMAIQEIINIRTMEINMKETNQEVDLIVNIAKDDIVNVLTYKQEAMQKVRNYLKFKDEKKYSEENLQVIANILSEAETEIFAGQSREEIDESVNSAKAKIDKVRQKTGRFYTLGDAIELNMLAATDVLTIGSYLAKDRMWTGTEENPEYIDFTPESPQPQLSELDEEIIELIKKTYYYSNKEEMDNEYRRYQSLFERPMDMLSVEEYLGEYNGVYVVRLDLYYAHTGASYFMVSYYLEEWGKSISWRQWKDGVAVFVYD